ncbi:MAG: hypothetical protein Q7R96_03300 [Nanoarchaeota archaeon]|nr:hypothetical protein [Nanoarchaeota archaeon]
MITFDQAVVDESLRQRYLDVLFERKTLPYAAGFVYMGESISPAIDWLCDLQDAGRISNDRRRMISEHLRSYVANSLMFVLNMPEETGSGNKLPIFVNGKAFRCLTRGGLENALFHERVHLDDFTLGVPLIDGSRMTGEDVFGVNQVLLTCYLEMRAHEEQLLDHLQQGFPVFQGSTVRDSRKELEDRFFSYLKIFWKEADTYAEETTDLEKKMIASAEKISRRFQVLKALPYGLRVDAV